jgi:hypothetical protein
MVTKKLTKDQITLHSEGAEFLVLGNLLIRGIPATKAYTNHPGWDVMAFNLKSGKSAKIQVKSRFARDAGDFLVSNQDFDFLIMAKLNRDRRYTPERKEDELPPEYYIIPIADLKKALRNPKTKNSMGGWSLNPSHLPKKSDFYKENWKQISKFLQL